MATKYVDIEECSKISDFISQIADKSNDRIKGALRHGISETINRIISKTQSNASSTRYKLTTPTEKYGVPLISGIRGYMIKGEATGFVNVLGNRKQNDGTWMLRFFEGGTKRGIVGQWFFRNAINDIDNLTLNNLQQSVNKAIDDINNGNK